MQDPPIQLQLEIQPCREPICGVFDDGRGDRRAFEGWMELAAVLQGYCDVNNARGPAHDTPP